MNESVQPSSVDDNPDSIFDSIVADETFNNDIDVEELEYEITNSYIIDEDDLDDLPDEERRFLEEQSHRLPPVPEGKIVSVNMVNFARDVTKAYRLCFFQFMHFVDQSPQLTPDLLGYCNRQNIDMFFRIVISKRTTSAAVNRRYVSAIQKYSDYWEERTGFVVESPVVKKALSDALHCRKQYLSANSRAHVDAHKHRPTKQPSPSQELLLIDLAWRDLRASRIGYLPTGINFLISWNSAMQAFTRGDEVRSSRLPDLCHEVNFGPYRLSEQGYTNIREQSSPHGILSIIQQPLTTKHMSNRAHAVGFFRHKDWRRCATSVIAFSIMARLHYMTRSQLEEFFLIGEDGTPNWYNYYLIDWRSYHSMADSFRDYMNQADVEYTKLTHVRKLGITRAHQMGASREDIILLSKHTVHKVDTSYMPELPYQPMLASAGFDIYRREEYFLPRSYVQVPPSWFVNVFPYINLWKTQVYEMRGFDKGKSAKTFVNDLLPHLAQVVLQDGIYLTQTYPEHPYSIILMEKMHFAGYELWASQMRHRIQSREHTVSLNVSGDHRYETILQSSERTVNKVISMEHRIDLLQEEIVLLQNMLRQHTNRCSNVNNHTSQLVTPVHLDATAFRIERDDSTISSEHRTLISAEPIPLPQTNTRVIPSLPPNIHKTVVQNMEFWLSNKLWEFDNRKDLPLRQLGWDLPTQLRFCRRRDIAKWVKTIGEKVWEFNLAWGIHDHIFLHMAKILDEERGRKTVMKAVNEFMNNSPLSWRIKRARKSYNTTI
jgi:hypothetical protein